MAAPFRIYNTLTRAVEDFVPLEPGHIRLYVCGLTVYDDAHVGHARMMVIFDAFVRTLRSRGWNVRYVRNYTDVDDKIIRRAHERGEDPFALAQRYIDRWREDAAGLGLLEPDEEPRVTRSIDEIQAMIATLVEEGHAYEADGSVWFSVESCEGYGKLSGQQVGELRNPDTGSGKRAPADFALWKAEKPGEPSWDSPWGPGRPGWHIECSAMARRWLGTSIDIHGGGLDLVFPHHENEVAQSECANHAPFARYWMHNGLLVMPDGAKMGKSEGNAFVIKDVLDQYPAEALRLYYLQTHYRSPLPWTEDSLDEALGALARLYEAREVAEKMEGSEDPEAVARDLGEDARRMLELGRTFREQFLAALADDFNTAHALGLTFEVARAINRLSNHKTAKKRAGPVVAEALAALPVVAETLGLLAMSTEAFQDEVKAKRLPRLGLTADEVDKLVAERLAARQRKDWAAADAIRDRLEAASIAVMDHAEGSDWRVRL